MDLKAVSGGDMSKKRHSKVLSMVLLVVFLLKKKVVLGNIKHSDNEKDISLSKSGSDNSVYFNANSLSGDDENVSMAGINSGSLLGLAATIFKTKCINTGAAFCSLLGSPNFDMDDNKKMFLLPCLFISLDKKWVDLKIVKTQVKVLVKQSFALDINLSAVEEKSMTAKIQIIRKFFSTISGFGGVTTSSKFEGII
ncbi:hypothetical protein G9A89_023983 [Geosiphon pyriformis]|nr:hypothetical protein G9A89_023983 [Geosiphon pyriformis]